MDISMFHKQVILKAKIIEICKLYGLGDGVPIENVAYILKETSEELTKLK